VQIITIAQLQAWQDDYPDARYALEAWLRVTAAAHWRNLMEVRRDFRTADGVTTENGNVVIVFNIRHNRYRLLTSIQYRLGAVIVHQFLTHREYDRETWKRQL
jgi:mRNA interferase HigB